MEIGTLPLPAKLKGKLISAGYTTRSYLATVPPADLARELRVSESDAVEILSHVADGGDAFVSGSRTAWDMLNEEALLQRITTSSADLDYILDGGISCGEVTEIGGVPGIGKTQMGIQLAVNVQIPVDCGGVRGKAIYIDTEGSFMLERVLQIAEACIDNLRGNAGIRCQPSQSGLHPKAFLENIFYFRVCSSVEQIALVNYLDNFISEQREIKIVIIDSVTFHFRQDFDDLGLRTRILSEMALKLMKLAHKFRIAVVLLNQVTTKHIEGSVHMTLALGDSWSHACTNRIILYWNGDERYAHIAKSPSLQSAAAPYMIYGRGIGNSKPGDERIKVI
ncbi:hypothetical protein MLD38_008064 [Melastoma candidum]|uniref:Uncharacterized protein n=1 Tax=Melastoma candidum TaxID=119954 RepID=A0ACB9RW68_9MYRT|nr:hypothetical protein MLD38_008064 [Melastoma candidum]